MTRHRVTHLMLARYLLYPGAMLTPYALAGCSRRRPSCPHARSLIHLAVPYRYLTGHSGWYRWCPVLLKCFLVLVVGNRWWGLPTTVRNLPLRWPPRQRSAARKILTSPLSSPCALISSLLWPKKTGVRTSNSLPLRGCRCTSLRHALCAMVSTCCGV